MKHYTSISDFLEDHGWKAEDGEFTKYANYSFQRITHEDWKGLSLEAFMRKARLKKWVPLDPEMSLNAQLGEEEASKFVKAAINNNLKLLCCEEMEQAEEKASRLLAARMREVEVVEGQHLPPGSTALWYYKVETPHTEEQSEERSAAVGIPGVIVLFPDERTGKEQ